MPPPASWQGTIRSALGNALPGVQVELRPVAGEGVVYATSDGNGTFMFASIADGRYYVYVRWRQQLLRSDQALEIREDEELAASLEITPDGHRLVVRMNGNSSLSAAGGGRGLDDAATASRQGSGGETLSSKQVSNLPLNKRDFSQLLLLAAGTQTDTNGSSNFTQQFAVNGQRGSTAVFAIDGIFASDPEISGATFSNFNVEAIQEIRSSSGVMQAEIGEGAASLQTSSLNRAHRKSTGRSSHSCATPPLTRATFLTGAPWHSQAASPPLPAMSLVLPMEGRW